MFTKRNSTSCYCQDIFVHFTGVLPLPFFVLFKSLRMWLLEVFVDKQFLWAKCLASVLSINVSCNISPRILLASPTEIIRC